jgi:hypothetical protein
MKPRSRTSLVDSLSPAVLVSAVVLLLSFLGQPESRAAERPADCRIGIYRLENGENVDIGATDDDHLRWRRNDGTTGLLTRAGEDNWTSTTGWTGRPDGNRVAFSGCQTGRIRFDGVPGQRIALEVTNVSFGSAGAQLAGRLVMPKGEARVPIVILVHGSENFSAREFYSLQRQFPAEGMGVFVYDKRGTGGSGGRYTQNYLLLADDAIAAANEAKRLAGARAGRVGYQGGSQGGWVAPLAAKIAPVDFVIVGFGLAVSPLEEDRESLALDMSDRHYGPEVMAKAMELADATATIVRSDFRDGYDRLATVRGKYGNEPWFRYAHGDITFFLLAATEAKLRVEGPTLLAGVIADYDPMPVLNNLDTPQLWILGADDHDAPSAETVRRLRNLKAQGKPINIAVFPHTEHGIYEYEVTPAGERVDTRNPDGYFKMMCDFVKNGRTRSSYGDVTVTQSRNGPRTDWRHQLGG